MIKNFLLSVFVIFLITGCTSVNDDSEEEKVTPILPIEIINTLLDGTITGSSIIEYDGSKISKIISLNSKNQENSRISFTYEGDRIIKTETKNYNGVIGDINEYTYVDGKVATRKYTNNNFYTTPLVYTVQYEYPDENTVKYQIPNYYGSGPVNGPYSWIINGYSKYEVTSANGKVISVKRNLNNTEYKSIFTYDTKNYAFKNVTGAEIFYKLKDGPYFISNGSPLNNEIKVEYSKSNTSQVDLYLNQIEYNSEEFPTTIHSVVYPNSNMGNPLEENLTLYKYNQ